MRTLSSPKKLFRKVLETKEGCVSFSLDRGRSLKRLHRPNLVGLAAQVSRIKRGLDTLQGFNLFAVNVGLIKPRRGPTPAQGQIKKKGRQDSILLEN